MKYNFYDLNYTNDPTPEEFETASELREILMAIVESDNQGTLLVDHIPEIIKLWESGEYREYGEPYLWAWEPKNKEKAE